MRCPYCAIAIYREQDLKDHVEWQHWNEQGYQHFVNSDLSRFFPVDEDGNPIITAKDEGEFPEIEDKGSNLPFGAGSDFTWEKKR